MTSDDLTKLFWIVKRVLDEGGHYLLPQRRTSFKNTLCGLLELRDVMKKKEEAKFFKLCHYCKRQIDIREQGWTFVEDQKIVHRSCPVLKPDEQRDETNFY